MNLEDLNQIANEEKDLLKKANKLDEQSAYLAKKRNGMTTLSGFIRDMRSEGWSGFDDAVNNEIKRVVDSISNDVFRAVEMKFAADARALRIKAKLKNQQIRNFLPDSEVQ